MIRFDAAVGFISDLHVGSRYSIWPEYFEKVLAGEKNFDLRLADWECKAGDILLLREWNPETKKYTGRQIEKEVSCVIKSKNLNMFSKNDVEKFGYQAIGFK